MPPVAIDALWPIAPLFDDSGAKHTNFAKLDESFSIRRSRCQVQDRCQCTRTVWSFEEEDLLYCHLCRHIVLLFPLGASFPSTISMPHMTRDSPQATEWYSLPKGCGLRGTYMYPGQLYSLLQGDMLSSKQLM